MKSTTHDRDVPRRLNVVQMIDSLGAGGAEKMVLLLARKSAQAGIPFSVISLSGDEETDIAREIRGVNGRVFHFPAGKMLDVKRILSIGNLLRQEKFDLVQTYLTYSNIVGSLAGILSGVPVICSLRNVDEAPEYSHPGRRFIETLCLNLFAARVMGNGYAIAKAHSKRVITRAIDVIPNATMVPDPISSDERNALRSKMAGDISRPLVISVGRLIHQKGYPELISSIAFVREKIPAVILLIAGEGAGRENLEHQIERMDLVNNVKLLGYRNDIQRLLQACDVFVSASLFEGMSVAILEAMAAGLPVIATDVGDASRVIVENTGIVVPTRQPACLAESITSILMDRETGVRMGAAGRARVLDHYSPDAWFIHIYDLYEKTIQRK